MSTNEHMYSKPLTPPAEKELKAKPHPGPGGTLIRKALLVSVVQPHSCSMTAALSILVASHGSPGGPGWCMSAMQEGNS